MIKLYNLLRKIAILYLLWFHGTADASACKRLRSEVSPEISIVSANRQEYDQINWQPLLGKEVSVVYDLVKYRDLSKVEKTVIQTVTSLQGESKRDPLLRPFLNEVLLAKQDGEVGIWLIKTKNSIYRSELMKSDKIAEIDPLEVKRGWEEVRDAFLDSPIEDNPFDEIILIHRHPGSGSPLSIQDREQMQVLNKGIGEIGGKQKIRILALPQEDKGTVCFRHTIYP